MTAEQPMPVTITAVAGALGSYGWVTETRGGAVRGAWDGFELAFSLPPAEHGVGGPDDGDPLAEHVPHLVVEGEWGLAVPPDMRVAVRMAANDWNRDQPWPTAMVVPHGEGWTVRTRFVVDVEDGLSRGQLRTVVNAAVRASVAMLKALGTPERTLED